MEERKDSMLETAYKCFQSASSTCGGECNEEEWLIHYMLGKISEKCKLPPKDYLRLYKQVNYWSTPVQHNMERVVPYWKDWSLKVQQKFPTYPKLNGSVMFYAWIYKANIANTELITFLCHTARQPEVLNHSAVSISNKKMLNYSSNCCTKCTAYNISLCLMCLSNV